MKRPLHFLFALALMLAAFCSRAQFTYNHLLGNTNKWDIYSEMLTVRLAQNAVFANVPSGSIITLHDTVIGPYTYKAFYARSHDPNYVPPTAPLSFLREDTLTGKVWLLPSDSSSERVIYDFSLQTGDSIYLTFRYQGSSMNSHPLHNGWYRVDSTGTTTIYPGTRKTWMLSNSANPLTPYNTPQVIRWIEGVGSTISPLYLEEDLDFSMMYGQQNWCADYHFSLACSFTDSVSQYHSLCWDNAHNYYPLYGDSCIFMLAGGVEDHAGLQTSMNISPNPSTGMFTMNLAVAGTDLLSAELYNMLGERIETVMTAQSFGAGQHEVAIDVSNVKPGAYLLYLQGTKNIAVQQLMISK